MWLPNRTRCPAGSQITPGWLEGSSVPAVVAMVKSWFIVAHMHSHFPFSHSHLLERTKIYSTHLLSYHSYITITMFSVFHFLHKSCSVNEQKNFFLSVSCEHCVEGSVLNLFILPWHTSNTTRAKQINKRSKIIITPIWSLYYLYYPTPTWHTQRHR